MSDRRRIALRQFVATGLAVFALLFVVSRCTGCAQPRSQLERAGNALTVEQYRRALDECIAEGKAAKSFAVYETCANEADKHYGGSPK